MITFPELLAARAAADPLRTAILVPGARRLTFGEWEARSNAVAHGLLRRGLRRGDRVALVYGGEGWIDYAVAYCAVQKAGGCAVPLSDRLAPVELRRTLARCSAAGVLSGATPGSGTAPAEAADSGHAPEALAGAAGFGGWWKTVASLEGAETGPPGVEIRPDDLAQILYTSGTTGEPKGVGASHANLTFGQRAHPVQRRYAHSEHFLHAFPIGTNAAQMMLMDTVAAHPSALVQPRFEAGGFCRLIEEYQVGTVFVVPSTAIELLGAAGGHDLSSVVLLSSSAAALPGAVALELGEAFPNATIVNYYTSTEAVPAQATMIFDPDRPASVGMPSEEVMVAGADGDPLPEREVGEVWLRSPGAPRSYVGDPAATAEVFRDGWVRMGDLGYLDEDGYLFLVDRESDVIKSGGLKVSTLHVEEVLYAHPEVAQAAVLDVPHPVMGAAVVAAVVPKGHAVDLGDLRSFLKARLAPHELPTRILALDALPRNDTGKVVKRELRATFLRRRHTMAVPPAPGTEAALAGLWSSVLGVRDVGADDDFFELGGDSFKATRLVSLASDRFGVRLPVSLAFDAPVLAGQAAAVDAAGAGQGPAGGSGAEGGDSEEVRTSGVAGEVTLSALQEYFLRWMYETPEPRAVSAVHVAIRITDELDTGRLRRSLHEIVARHEALRTVFPGHAARVLAEPAPELVELHAPGEREASAAAARELERPFDVTTGPLTRAIVVHLAPEDHLLVLGVHHLVADGWSLGVLLRELGLRYSSSPLEPARHTAGEAGAWAARHWPRAREHWRDMLRGAPSGFPAPGRREVAHFSARSLPLRVPAGVTVALRRLAREHDASLSMALLAAWAGVLARWTGASDLVFLAPVPGRTRQEFESVVGCLVQSLLLRVDAGGGPSFEELLGRVRAAVLAATEHQYYPYEEFSRRIRYPAWFRFESWDAPAHFPGLESGPHELPRELMFDWALPPGELDIGVPELALAQQPDGSVAGWLVYNRLAFETTTIERLARAFLDFSEHGWR
jgi:acyl-CoA synthetase (AMP-forming)/AMP-acid ligase II/acyl carrier protein